MIFNLKQSILCLILPGLGKVEDNGLETFCLVRFRGKVLKSVFFSPSILWILFVFMLLDGCTVSQRWKSQWWLYEENATRGWAYFYQGLQYESQKRWKEAAIQFDKASSISPTESRIYSHLALCLLHLKRRGKALEFLQLAEKYALPNDYLIHFDIGNAYRLAGRWKDAKRNYLKAMAIFPGFQKGREALEKLARKKQEGCLQ